jgi:hypothetical protein
MLIRNHGIDEYGQLVGVFGTRMGIVRMQLGNEIIELTEYLAPRGKPVPTDSRSNDLIVLPKGENSFSKGVLLSDPDGHAMLRTQK